MFELARAQCFRASTGTITGRTDPLGDEHKTTEDEFQLETTESSHEEDEEEELVAMSSEEERETEEEMFKTPPPTFRAPPGFEPLVAQSSAGSSYAICLCDVRWTYATCVTCVRACHNGLVFTRALNHLTARKPAIHHQPEISSLRPPKRPPPRALSSIRHGHSCMNFSNSHSALSHNDGPFII